MIRDILQQYRDESAFNRDLGDRFERLMRAYLKLDPQYLALFEDVWLWKDWPQREALGYKLPDTGIDLVAKLRDEDGFCAIQCKFYDSPIPMGDLGNFFTLSGKGGFTQRLIVATAPLSKHAADALEGQTIPVELMTLEDLEASPIDWSQFSLDKPDQLRKLPKKDPRPHQSEALTNVTKGFQAHDRGKLIMACGTGKTYTSLNKIIRRRRFALRRTPSCSAWPRVSCLLQRLRQHIQRIPNPLRPDWLDSSSQCFCRPPHVLGSVQQVAFLLVLSKLLVSLGHPLPELFTLGVSQDGFNVRRQCRCPAIHSP